VALVFLADLGLKPKAVTIRIMHLQMDGEGLCIEDLLLALPGSLTRVSCRSLGRQRVVAPPVNRTL
jgi:hypothetical protein